MTWAARRRALIILIASLVALSALSILAFSIWYETPTCTDRKQNQDEQGIDCGGSCTTLCSFQVASEPVVRFVRPLAPQPGRVDVVAYIENRNTDAESRNAPFLLEVFAPDRRLIGKRTIAVDLPPSSSVPVYVPDIAPRGNEGAQAFLTPILEDLVWTRTQGERPVPPSVENMSVAEGAAPRITAVLSNPLARPVYDTTLIATVFDVSGNAIAASQTFVPEVPSQGETAIVFTWNAPFTAPVARVEILPVPRLPSP